MRYIRYASTLFIVLACLLIGTVSVLAVTFTTTQVTNNAGENQYPEISGDYVVWQGHADVDDEIYLYQISTGTTTQVTNNTADDKYPKISGDYVVWVGSPGYEIYLYQISTGTTTQVSYNTPTVRDFMVSGDYVVWTGDADGDFEIYLYQISTATTTQLTHNTGSDVGSQIFGDYVVWASNPGVYRCDYEIYLYQISTSTTTQVTNNRESDQYPEVSGDYVVWQGHADGDEEIYLYQISTGITTQVSHNTTPDYHPKVSGDYVVWGGSGANFIYEINLYQISTGTTTQVSYQTIPEFDDISERRDIDGDYVAWWDWQDGNPSIYLYEISTATTTQLTNSAPKKNYYISVQLYGSSVVYTGLDGLAGWVQIYLTQFRTSALNGAAEINADQPIVVISRPHIGTEIMAYNGATSGATTSYLPMLFNNKWGYTSTFTVQNTGAGTASYTITFKDAADGLDSCVLSGESLPQHGVLTYDVTNLGACDSGTLPTNWFGGATITSDEPLAVIAKPDINGTDSVTYSAFTGGADTTYLPMLFRSKWGYESAFYVQNLDGSLAANVTIEFYDAEGNFTCSYADPSSIGPSVTRGYWMASINDTTQCLGGTGFPDTGWAGSAVIRSTGSSNIVAIGRPHLGVEVASYNGFTTGGTTNYLPMLFRGQWGYDAAFYIQNISGSDTTIAVTFYDTTGAEVCTYTDPTVLGPNATRGYWTPGLNCNDGSNFDPAGWAGSAKIVTSQEVIAVGRPHLSNGQVMVYNAFTGGSTTAYVPFNFRSWNGNETALYIQNLGASDATTTITFYDEEDGFFCQLEQVVSPGASGAIWLAELVEDVCVP
jgi:beta propeller repeat protein